MSVVIAAGAGGRRVRVSDFSHLQWWSSKTPGERQYWISDRQQRRKVHHGGMSLGHIWRCKENLHSVARCERTRTLLMHRLSHVTIFLLMFSCPCLVQMHQFWFKCTQRWNRWRFAFANVCKRSWLCAPSVCRRTLWGWTEPYSSQQHWRETTNWHTSSKISFSWPHIYFYVIDHLIVFSTVNRKDKKNPFWVTVNAS